MAIELTFIDPLGGSIEASPSTGDTFEGSTLALFPDIDLIFCNDSIEGNHGELGILGKPIKFSKERLIVCFVRLIKAP